MNPHAIALDAAIYRLAAETSFNQLAALRVRRNRYALRRGHAGFEVNQLRRLDVAVDVVRLQYEAAIGVAAALEFYAKTLAV